MVLVLLVCLICICGIVCVTECHLADRFHWPCDDVLLLNVVENFAFVDIVRDG